MAFNMMRPIIFFCVEMSLAHGCTIEDRAKLRPMGQALWGIGNSVKPRVEITKRVFAYIFERDPTAKELFKDVNVADMDSPEFEAHMLRIINGVSLLVNFMQDTPALTAAVKHMADQHASRHGVTAFQFQLMNEAFTLVMPEIDNQFDPDASNNCWHTMVDGITAKLP